MDLRRQTPTIARLLLAAAFLVCAIGMIGPFQGVEDQLISPDKAAHFTAFYGLTLLLFAAFPNRRRVDLAVLTTCIGAGIEVIQTLTGRDGELGDVAADALGAFAVLAPVWLDALRRPKPLERRRRLKLIAPVDEAQSEPQRLRA
jgi:VanZ family protein